MFSLCDDNDDGDDDNDDQLYLLMSAAIKHLQLAYYLSLSYKRPNIFFFFFLHRHFLLFFFNCSIFVQNASHIMGLSNGFVLSLLWESSLSETQYSCEVSGCADASTQESEGLCVA